MPKQPARLHPQLRPRRIPKRPPGRGRGQSNPRRPIEVGSSLKWPRAVSGAREVLRLAGVNGPHALALGGEAYDELTAGGDDGYPLRKHVDKTFADRGRSSGRRPYGEALRLVNGNGRASR